MRSDSHGLRVILEPFCKLQQAVMCILVMIGLLGEHLPEIYGRKRCDTENCSNTLKIEFVIASFLGYCSLIERSTVFPHMFRKIQE